MINYCEYIGVIVMTLAAILTGTLAVCVFVCIIKAHKEDREAEELASIENELKLTRKPKASDYFKQYDIMLCETALPKTLRHVIGISSEGKCYKNAYYCDDKWYDAGYELKDVVAWMDYPTLRLEASVRELTPNAK